MPARGRRRILRTALGVGAAGALGAAGTLPAAAAAAGRGGDGLPPVPGMLGDRRANEFWYLLDEATLHHPTQEFTEAFQALIAVLGTGWDVTLLRTWLGMVNSPDYPRDFTDWATPLKEPLSVISRVQLEVIDAVYRRHDHRLAQAFGWFGQGVLFDPRTGKPHVMTGDPPGGYPVWHVTLRAMMFLGISPGRWAEIAPLNAFGCAVQLTADPDQQNVNPPLPRATIRKLAAHWLPRDPARLDVDFQSFPYPEWPPESGQTAFRPRRP
ncbi:hypothetical protein [Streptomyces sp. NBC_01716]|uniref:hypothetical protein n=1 Tax=Streptomyces sp. NBC_01716 TaxID=2975917 RepID=UPI002E320320|nr:hypothetical protein [Streptomyces sp. NBC_01716]